MGPILIFDKSTLQSLNVDEAMWLDNFFLSNITPLFFVETLADLEKEIRDGRTPEDVVGNLALKTPDMSSKVNVHHSTLLQGELLGAAEVDMRFGRPIISGGPTKELGGKTGVMFQPSPEEEAFQRWQKREFLELERLLARKWRDGLSSIDFEEAHVAFKRFFVPGKPKNLQETKELADSLVDGPNQEEIFSLGMNLLGVAPGAQVGVLDRWKAAGSPPLREFVQYFAYVISVDLLFYLAIAADLIGRQRASHKVDLAYLYYLPFCMAFTSNDKLHSKIVPLFLSEKQSFVSGTELKADLAKLDAHYDAFPNEVKSAGIMSFAAYPPQDDSFLVTQLWDKHMASGWRERPSGFKPEPGDPTAKKLTEEMRRFEEEGNPVPDSEGITSDQAEFVTFKRVVVAKKGKWNRFPPEVLDQSRDGHE